MKETQRSDRFESKDQTEKKTEKEISIFIEMKQLQVPSVENEVHYFAQSHVSTFLISFPSGHKFF